MNANPLAKPEFAETEAPALSRPLPPRYFWDATLYEQEKRNVFAKSWRYVGHQSELPDSGNYTTIRISDQSIFVIRGEDGELRAFYNVCQHRAAELLVGKGTVRNFVTCPYHSWGYDHKGCLRAAANSANVPGFDKSQFSLSPVRLEVWCGFIFVNLDPVAEPLAVKAAELEPLMRRFCPGIDKLKLAERVEYHVKANWKTVVDNFIESYHLKLSGPAHKAFTDLVDCRDFKVTTHPGGSNSSYFWSAHTAPAGAQANRAFQYADVRVLGECNDFLSVHMFPDIGFVFFPGADCLALFVLPPAGAEATDEIMAYYTPDGSFDQDTKKGMDYFSLFLGPEDNDLVERVQRGLRSPGYRGGALMVDASRSGISEHAVQKFHEQLRVSIDGA
jgi:choline monooxygenase